MRNKKPPFEITEAALTDVRVNILIHLHVNIWQDILLRENKIKKQKRSESCNVQDADRFLLYQLFGCIAVSVIIFLDGFICDRNGYYGKNNRSAD